MDRSVLCVLFLAFFLEAAFCLPSTPKPDCHQKAENGKTETDCDDKHAQDPDAGAKDYDDDAENWSENPADPVVDGLKKIESGVEELIGQLDPDTANATP